MSKTCHGHLNPKPGPFSSPKYYFGSAEKLLATPIVAIKNAGVWDIFMGFSAESISRADPLKFRRFRHLFLPVARGVTCGEARVATPVTRS